MANEGLQNQTNSSPAFTGAAGSTVNVETQAQVELQREIARAGQLPNHQRPEALNNALESYAETTGNERLKNALISAREAIVGIGPQATTQLLTSVVDLAKSAGDSSIEIRKDAMQKQLDNLKEMLDASKGFEIESDSYQTKAVGIMKFIGTFAKALGFGDAILKKAEELEADINPERYQHFVDKIAAFEESIVDGNFANNIATAGETAISIGDQMAVKLEDLADNYVPEEQGTFRPGAGSGF